MRIEGNLLTWSIPMKKVFLALSLVLVLSACVDNTRRERRADEQNPNVPPTERTQNQ